jgi:hypothetical protein
LDLQPFAHLGRQWPPLSAIGDYVAHARREVGRQGKFAAFVGRDFRVFRGRPRNIDFVFDQGLVPQDLPCEHECVSGNQRLDEIFFDFAEKSPAARNHFCGTRTHEAHLEHIGLDDGADIHAIALRNHGVAYPPAPILALPDLRKPLIGLERVTAGCDEIEHRIEISTGKTRVWGGAPHLGIKRIGKKWLPARRAENMLRKHVEAAYSCSRGVLHIVCDCLQRGAALHDFEAVGGNEHAFRGLVHAVIGATDALQQARCAFRRADIDDEIDVSPIDAKIER